jgi:hypothetical protein
MGPRTYEIAGESQSVLIMSNPIISPRTRAPAAAAAQGGGADPPPALPRRSLWELAVDVTLVECHLRERDRGREARERAAAFGAFVERFLVLGTVSRASVGIRDVCGAHVMC